MRLVASFSIVSLLLSGCGARTDPGAPTEGADPVVQLAAKGDRACVLRGSGVIACWGFLQYGGSARATFVAREPHAIALAVRGPWSLPDRRVVLALLDDGRVVSFDPAEPSAGVEVPGLLDAVELSAGGTGACARRRGGTVVCWGDDTLGQLGDGTSGGFSAVPREVVGLSGAVEIAVGEFSACARLVGGGVRCWGSDYAGQLGDGAPPESHLDCPTLVVPCSARPVAVDGVDDAVAISAGLNDVCARRATGEILCWGWNTAGQLGDGGEVDRQTPHPTFFERGATVITGYQHTCALGPDRIATCAGAGSPSTVPVAVPDLGPVKTIAGGWSTTCAVRMDGGVVCWTRIDVPTPPTVVPGL